MIFALEGLRGLAALFVALFHAWDSFATSSPLIRQGWLFVDLFFVISGYVMAHVYGRHLANRSQATAFVIKRFGRLYPLHIVTLFGFIACEFALQFLKLFTGLGANRPTFDLVKPWSLLSNVLLLQGVGLPGERIYNTPSWSISAETWTYLLFAGLFLSVKTPTRARACLAISAAGLVLWIAAAGEVEKRTIADFLRCIYGFFLGTLLPQLRGRIAPSRAVASLFQLAAAARARGVLWLESSHPAVRLLAPLAFAMLVLAVSLDYGFGADFLRLAPMQTLGRLSYSIYMTHYVVLVFFHPVVPLLKEPYRSLVLVVYLAIVLGVSALTFRWVEAPWRNRFNRKAARMTDTATASAARTPAQVLPGSRS
jgi:peptidoglycan/LPS O-acetylase OafA/YrhL